MPRALILVADGFPTRDVQDVAKRLHDQGFETRYCGAERGATYKAEDGTHVVADLGYLNVDLSRYALVVVPGGAAGDALAAHKSMYNIVYSLLHKGRTAAVVGTGLNVLLAAAANKTSPNPVATGTHILEGEIARDRRVTGPEALREAAEKAGAVWTEEPVVQDGPVISAVELQGENLRLFIEALLPSAQRIPV